MITYLQSSYSTVSRAWEAAIYIAIGQFNYASLVQASSPMAAGIYFYSFIFIITIVVMQMVIAVIFTAFDSIRERIDTADDLRVSPTIFRKLVLGRVPSLFELDIPLYELFRKRMRGAFARQPKKKVAPLGSDDEGRDLKPEDFSDDDLLLLFDSDHIFRTFGIISPLLESSIISTKIKATAERRKAEIERHVLKHFGADTESALRPDNDPWQLDRHEFTSLLRVLDEREKTLNINVDKFSLEGQSNELIITDLIFKHYARPKTKIKSTFKNRVDVKLEAILKLVQKLDAFDVGLTRPSSPPPKRPSNPATVAAAETTAPSSFAPKDKTWELMKRKLRRRQSNRDVTQDVIG